MPSLPSSPPGLLPPTDLPIEAAVPALRAALAERGVAVVVAEPGAGKSTIVPLRVVTEPWCTGRVLVLEPRRVAARATAARMAALIGEPVGATVGHRTRDDSRVGPTTRVEVVTEGVLTRVLQHDPELAGVTAVIFDEVHERNLHGDVALALAIEARRAFRPDLRLVAMSATVDAERFARLLGTEESGGRVPSDGAPPSVPAPVIEAGGRPHPVEVRWRPSGPGPLLAAGPRRLGEAVARVVEEAVDDGAGGAGAILVFVPGVAEINATLAALRNRADLHARPLHGGLRAADQDAVLQPPATAGGGPRRVIVATALAETSLTVPDVTVVVDAGLDRRAQLDRHCGLSRLVTVAASQDAAHQRAGRAGRVQPGVAYRLWSEPEHRLRDRHRPPELEGADLTGAALEAACWGTTLIDLPLPSPPRPQDVAAAVSTLELLGALGHDGRPTARGEAMAELPLHPRLARMVVAAGGDRRALACVVAAVLEERDLLRGAGADLRDRVRLLADRDAVAPAMADAVRARLRRAGQLWRRTGTDGRRWTTTDLDALGPLAALAHPDRIAQRRGPGRYRLPSGRAVTIDRHDPLAAAPWLVVCDTVGRHDGDDAIAIAAALDLDDVLEVVGPNLVEEVEVRWDDGRGDLVARTASRYQALVVRSHEDRPRPGPEATGALVHHLTASRLADLPWTSPARSLQARVAFLRTRGHDLADLSDDALVADVDQWLTPLLGGATGRSDLARLDVAALLRGRLGHTGARSVDRTAPPSLTLPSGTSVPIAYGDGAPRIEARPQDLYGLADHPVVAGEPVVVTLLSPADRPIQVTADLPGFWAGSWTAVRKEMAARYPKHNWPADPVAAVASRRAQRGR